MIKLTVAVAIFIKNVSENGYSLWMQKRPKDAHLAGLLEFPGGKVEKGEVPEEALKRELKEEINLDLRDEKIRLFKIQKHTYPEREVLLYTYLINGEERELCESGHREFSYNFEEVLKDKDKYPAANIEIMEQLSRYIKKHNDANLMELLWQK